jgi:hypothetical protein
MEARMRSAAEGTRAGVSGGGGVWARATEAKRIHIHLIEFHIGRKGREV